jgi:PAS domain S-box-containing protein
MRKKLAQTMSRAASIGGGIEREDRLGALASVGALLALTAADVALGEEVILTGTLVLVPFVAALWSGVMVTAVVAVAAVAVGLSSGAWNMDFGQTDYDARVLVLAVGGLFAVASAWAREESRRGTRRLELLNSVGAIADGSLLLAETLERVIDVIVPAFADFCMVDAIHDQRVIRSAVRADGREDAREIEKYLFKREPSPPEWMIREEAPFPRHPRFIPRFNDEMIRRLAHEPGDLAWMRSLGLTSSITVPLLSRGRMLGALTFNTAWSQRHYAPEDVRFAQTLAGRVALALDNAGLFSDLESVERRMDNVMSILDEAVVIHDADGELVFANPAASRLLGFDTTGSAASTATAGIQERYRIRAEDGTPLTAEELVGRRALKGEPTDPLVLRVADRDGGPERWLITRAKPILGPEGRPLYSVTAIEDVTAVKRAEFGQRLLAREGALIASSTNSAQMLQGVAELAVPEFAEWCSVSVPGEDGRVEFASVAHADEERRKMVAELIERYPQRVEDAAGIPEVMRTGEARLVAMPDEAIADIAADAEHARRLKSIGLRSLIMAPMSSGGRIVGVLALGNGEGGRDFDQTDLELAVEISNRAGVAVENARLADERAEVARVLQEGLMPRALPHMSGWESAAVYQPAGEVNAVGGDFYDAFEIKDGWMVTVGDVVGRGAAAASLTALARHTIRTAGMLTGDPCQALAMLDEALRERGETALCTAAILILPRTQKSPVDVSFVSGGHPLPLLIHDGEVAEAGVPGPLLGAFEESSWERTAIRLEAGDQLVLFTDGVFEARGPDGRFGEERLRAALAGADRPLSAIGRVTAALEAFSGGEPEDDVALVAVRRSRSPQPRQASGANGSPAGAKSPSRGS